MKKTRKPRKGRPRSSNLLPAPAPGRLAIIQDFVNTRDDDMERDELSTPEALSRWLAKHKLLPAATPLDEGVLLSALEVREGLRSLIHTNRGLALNERTFDRLNRAIRAARPLVTLGAEGRISLEPAKPGWDAVVAQMVDVIVEAVVQGHWQKLKTCYNPKCQWAFYDASRNGSRIWCSQRRCGSRVHSRRYRRRGPSYTRIGWTPP